MKNVTTGNAEFIRKINLDLITNAILETKCISRSEIAKKIGLTLPTVMRIVDVLLADGSVIEVGQGNSSGGRKPTMLEMNENHTFYIGACIQRKLKIVLANAVGKIISRFECIFDYSNIDASILDQISVGVEAVIEQANVPRDKICSIGIGTPGSDFSHTDKVMRFPFAQWANFDINAWNHSNQLPFPSQCENIPKLGALAELRFGGGRHIKDFIYIYADFGIGASIVTDGKLYMGASGVAGEFGHMIIERNGRECYCGKHGCIEMYASSIAILNQIRDEMSKRHFVVNQISVPEKLQFTDVLEALNQNDREVESVFQQAGECLGIGLANLINLLNPQMIIIGGELSDCAAYVQAAEKVALNGIFLHRAEKTEIVTSKLGDDDLLKGAISLAMNERFSLL